MKLICEIQALDGADTRAQADVFAAFVESLVEVNRATLRVRRSIPLLYQSRIAFQEDPRWQDVTSMLSTGYGDCKDLVAWRLAELRELNRVEARLHVVFSKAGDTDVFHMQVLHPTGHLEDPTSIIRSIAASGTAAMPPGGLRILR